MSLNMQIGKIYTFNTLAPGILGIAIKNAKLISICDYATATSYDNIILKFRSIYPLLPAGTPNLPEACIYYHFLSESGAKIIFADQWIDETTVEIIDHINFTITFAQASIPDMSRVRDLLNAAGYTNYNITQTS